MDGDEAVKSPIPHALLHRELLPAKLLPFLSEVVANDRNKTSARQRSKLKNSLSKVWSMDEIHSKHPSLLTNDLKKDWSLSQIKCEISSAVKVSLGSRDNTELDPELYFTEMGLDSLASIDFPSRLGDAFRLEVSPALLNLHPNIYRLIKYFDDALGTASAHDIGKCHAMPDLLIEHENLEIS